MAWTEKYAKGYRGRYRTADGRMATAGSATTKKEALHLAQAEEHRQSPASMSCSSEDESPRCPGPRVIHVTG